MEISVFEILNSQNAMFHQDGLKLYAAIIEAFERGQKKVIVDFKNITVLTTQFLNASFGKLMVEKGMTFFEKNIKEKNIEHLSSYSTKLEWVIDNIKNDSNYKSVYKVALG